MTLSPEPPGIFRFRLAPAETPALAGGGSNPRVMARRGLVKWRMQSQTTPRPHGVPESFYSKFGKLITAVLSGFDRIRFRASLRMLYQAGVMERYLGYCGVKLKEFKSFAEATTAKVKAAAYQAARETGRPVQYLGNGELSKENLARELARRDKIKQGLIAVFTAVEPCLSYSLRGDQEAKQIKLVLETRKCTHFYHYYMHEQFGMLHVRVQSWLPFNVDVCLNGRAWLARQMDSVGIDYDQRDNCSIWVSDPVGAQELLDQQLQTDWSSRLDELLSQAHPLHAELGRPIGQRYYWSASQTEFATDLCFKDAASLQKLYPQFLHHAIRSFNSSDVLRFLGKQFPQMFRSGEVKSTLKNRPEGVRVRHSVKGNSLKLYDKEGSILRVETTIVRVEEFRVYRPNSKGELTWQSLRRGVADLWRRAQVSEAANGRYLEALAAVTGTTPLYQEARSVCRPQLFKGRRYRALNPWSEQDGTLLETISRGEFAINGLRNRDLQKLLYPGEHQQIQRRRQSAAITRKLALLRAHGLIRKVSGSHRYLLSPNGRRIITALLAARRADVDQLTRMAA